jgi:hypothetical protein
MNPILQKLVQRAREEVPRLAGRSDDAILYEAVTALRWVERRWPQRPADFQHIHARIDAALAVGLE